MLSRVMMKADPPQLLSELELLVVMLGSDPPQPPLRRGELELELELLPMYHSMMAVFGSNVFWNSAMSMGWIF